MTQEELKALGLSDEQAAGVIGLYKEKLDNSFIPKSRFNEVNEENKRLKGTIAERDKQLEDLKKSDANVDDLKKQIADLQADNAKAVKEHEAQIKQMKLDNAVEAALLSAGAKNIKAVRSLLDEKSLKLTEGGVDGLDAAIKAVQTSDPYLFKETETKPQGFTGFEPKGNGKAEPDINTMTYSEFMAANSNQ
jgi:myosin heavy subunit